MDRYFKSLLNIHVHVDAEIAGDAHVVQYTYERAPFILRLETGCLVKTDS